MFNLGDFGLQAAVLAVMVVGLLGLLTTIIPGLLIIWLAGLAYGIVTGFDTPGAVIFGVMTVLWIVGSLTDNFLMGASARRTGASWLSIGVALLLGLVGTFVLPPFGGLIGALLGMFAVEFLRLKDPDQAWRSTRSMAVGCGWAVGVRFLIGMVMIGLWGLWAFILPGLG